MLISECYSVKFYSCYLWIYHYYFYLIIRILYDLYHKIEKISYITLGFIISPNLLGHKSFKIWFSSFSVSFSKSCFYSNNYFHIYIDILSLVTLWTIAFESEAFNTYTTNSAKLLNFEFNNYWYSQTLMISILL